MKRLGFSLVLAGLVFFASSAAFAANPIVNGSGELIGANGVEIGGSFYDVVFADGNCVSLFGGCDEPGDFAFNDFASADAAALALLNQVFVDGVGLFDSSPELALGCSSEFWCVTNIPYGFGTEGVLIAGAFNENADNEIHDRTTNEGTVGIDPSITLVACCGAGDELNWAVFTPVPIPATAWLIMSALGICFGWRRS